MRRRRLRFLSTVALLVGVLASGPEAPAFASPPPASSSDESMIKRFHRSIDAWNLDEARLILGEIENDAQRELRAAIVEIYEADYAEAEARLAALVASGLLDSENDRARTEHYLQLARGAQLALGDATTIVSEDGHFEAVFANPKDELLAPYLFGAMARARDALADDIGVRPDHAIRFEILDDPAKLALVTPLTLENIYTTGTVGITKYRRIMMVSPRVMLRGYGWLDTAVHEYVHYLVTLRTDDEAPVWLQEGLAKLFQERWRREGPAPLHASVSALLHHALVEDELVTLEQMHPSVAMLPTQEMASLAYAEVETMLTLLRERHGAPAIHALMDRVAAGVDAKQALGEAWGSNFEEFESVWRREYRRRTSAGAVALRKPRFLDSNADPTDVDPSLLGDVFSHLGGGRARQHARLGVLLTLRGHPEAAVLEYERARRADRRVGKDPKLARRLGELYLELGRSDEARPLLDLAALDDPEDANLAAAQGRAHRKSGDPVGARVALERAIRLNPFIPGLHCDLAELVEGDVARARERLLCPD